ncbi:MAG: hypothetical protein V4493_01070 [Pseudomonadota bacterium]
MNFQPPEQDDPRDDDQRMQEAEYAQHAAHQSAQPVAWRVVIGGMYEYFGSQKSAQYERDKFEMGPDGTQDIDHEIAQPLYAAAQPVEVQPLTCQKCGAETCEIADCNRALCPTMAAFNRWWNSSKYMQVVRSDANQRRVSLDGWNAHAAHDIGIKPTSAEGGE